MKQIYSSHKETRIILKPLYIKNGFKNEMWCVIYSSFTEQTNIILTLQQIKKKLIHVYFNFVAQFQTWQNRYAFMKCYLWSMRVLKYAFCKTLRAKHILDIYRAT